MAQEGHDPSIFLPGYEGYFYWTLVLVVQSVKRWEVCVCGGGGGWGVGGVGAFQLITM